MDYLSKYKIVKLYRWLNIHNWEKVIFAILALCVMFDLVPCEYWPIFEDIFSICEGEYAGIAAMILVVWTFMMALIIFWMGRMEDRRYGIRIMDVYIGNISRTGLKDKYSKELAVKRLISMGEALIAELAAVFLATFFEWDITLKITAVLQILTMIYTFVAICIESSGVTVLELIVESSANYILYEQMNGKGINDFLANMIEGTEYRNESEVNRLNDTAVKITAMAEREISPEKEIGLQWFMKAYMDYIIHTCRDKEVSERIVKELFTKVDNVCAKKGIFLSVIDNEYQQGAPDALETIGINFKDRNLVIAAGLAYNEYICITTNYHKYLTLDLQKCISYPLTNEETEEIVNMWIELAKESEAGKNGDMWNWQMDRLWKIIFPYEGVCSWKEI